MPAENAHNGWRRAGDGVGKGRRGFGGLDTG
jgi:hypothetical protein